MNTAVTKRGQTVIPAKIRKNHNIQPGDRLVWIDDGRTIKIIPVPADPVNAFRGLAKGENLLEKLLEARREERERAF